MAGQESHRSEDPLWLFTLAVIASGAVLAAFAYLLDDLRRLTALAAWVHVWPFARIGALAGWLPGLPIVGTHLIGPSIAAETLLRIAWPGQIGQADWTEVQAAAGRAAAIIHGPGLLWLARRARQGRPDLTFRKSHSLESLIAAQSVRWPALRIVRHFGSLDRRINPDRSIAAAQKRRKLPGEGSATECGKLLRPELPPLTPPVLESALRPESWLRAQGLAGDASGANDAGLADPGHPARGQDDAWEHLTIDAVCEALEAQMGRPWTGFAGLPPMHRGLAAAFALGFDYRQQAAAELLTSLSVLADRTARNRRRLDEAIRGERLLVRRIDDELRGPAGARILRVAERHAWQSTAMISMLQAARKDRGVISTASFVWLKREDRSLWYALNASGNAAALAEAVGIFAHFRAERQAGQPLRRPSVFQAGRSLVEDYLDLGNPRTSRRKAAAERRKPVGDRLRAAAGNRQSPATANRSPANGDA